MLPPPASCGGVGGGRARNTPGIWYICAFCMCNCVASAAW